MSKTPFNSPFAAIVIASLILSGVTFFSSMQGGGGSLPYPTGSLIKYRRASCMFFCQGKCFSSGKIKLYNVDMLTFADDEKFDFIFDRARYGTFFFTTNSQVS